MADILIRGMEMPTNVFDCPLNSFGIYNLAQDETHCNCIEGSRPEWCPLVPLPEGHGRLIDADALIEDLERQCKEVFRIDAVSPDDYWITRNEAYNEALWKSWVESFGEYLKARLTIIPAEEGET